MRIRLETDAYFLILNAIQKGNYEIIVSLMHTKELESIEDIKERIQVIHLLDGYGKIKKYDLSVVKTRANEFIKSKFGIADALHSAFAEKSYVNYL
jgi:hypothetical protein